MNLDENIQDIRASPNKDWYSALDPITSLARIVGIFPLSLRGRIGGRNYSTSYAWLMYSFVILTLTISSFVMWTEVSMKTAEMTSRPAILQAVIRFEMVLRIFSTIVTLLSLILAKQKFANTISSLSAQDEALKKLGIRFDYAADFKQSFIRLGVVTSILSILYIYDFIHLLESNSRNPLNWMTWSLARLIHITGTSLFAELTLILKKKFTTLNEILIKIIQRSKDKSNKTILMRYKICTQIHSIAKIHGNLCESALNLNKIFGISMVVGVLLALAVLTSSSYYIIREIQKPDYSFVQIGGGVTWIMFNFADIIYVPSVCNMTRNQASLMGKLIHRLNIHEADTTLNTLIQNFSLQLHHGKLTFSGAGLFPLDATLIRSIVGAVTTYLVIMMQFDRS